jgi:ubiquinone/menaquinone biosynthesis C-methylase UbiE
MSTLLTLKMLNEEAASSKDTLQDIMERLQIQEAYAVADINSWRGDFTLGFAKKVGHRGKVYATVIQRRI